MRLDKPTNDRFWRALHDEVGLAGRAPLVTPGLWTKATFYLALVATGYGWLMSSPPTFAETAAECSLGVQVHEDAKAN